MSSEKGKEKKKSRNDQIDKGNGIKSTRKHKGENGWWSPCIIAWREVTSKMDSVIDRQESRYPKMRMS